MRPYDKSGASIDTPALSILFTLRPTSARNARYIISITFNPLYIEAEDGEPAVSVEAYTFNPLYIEAVRHGPKLHILQATFNPLYIEAEEVSHR